MEPQTDVTEQFVLRELALLYLEVRALREENAKLKAALKATVTPTED